MSPRFSKRPSSMARASWQKSAGRCRAARSPSEMATILVIEDNVANMTLATFILESEGHTVLRATDAETGLALARGERPRLILMDIQLPGMDGLEATASLKRDESTRTIPILALTA